MFGDPFSFFKLWFASFEGGAASIHDGGEKELEMYKDKGKYRRFLIDEKQYDTAKQQVNNWRCLTTKKYEIGIKRCLMFCWRKPEIISAWYCRLHPTLRYA